MAAHSANVHSYLCLCSVCWISSGSTQKYRNLWGGKFGKWFRGVCEDCVSLVKKKPFSVCFVQAFAGKHHSSMSVDNLTLKDNFIVHNTHASFLAAQLETGFRIGNWSCLLKTACL